MKKLIVLAAACLAGCAASSDGSGSIQGAIDGMNLHIQTALSSTAVTNAAAQTGTSSVVLGTWTNGCGLGPRVNPKSSQALLLVLSQAGTDGLSHPVTKPGTFSVAASAQPGNVTVTFVGNNDQCVVTSAAIGASGSVTVSAASADGLVGTLDVTMTNSDHVTGSFNAPDCAADNSGDGGATDGGSSCE